LLFPFLKIPLPIFVILPGTTSAAKRSVQLGWVVDFDDENRQFLILFGERKPEYQTAPTQETPFTLTEGRLLERRQQRPDPVNSVSGFKY
jgi:hypothetical protein